MYTDEARLFFFVFFVGGVVFHALGLVTAHSAVAVEMFAPAVLPFWHLFILSAVLGAVSGKLMAKEGTFKTMLLHMGGVPLLFVLGLDDIRALLLIGGMFIFYAIFYIIFVWFYYLSEWVTKNDNY